MGETTPNGGRRRVRSDAEALAAAVPSGMTIIKLGERYLRVVLDLISEFQTTRAPIPPTRRNEIIARHVRSQGSVIMSQLREKGAIVSDEGDTHHDKDVVPRYEGIIYVNSRSSKVVWPSQFAGKTLKSLGEVSAVVPAVPMAPAEPNRIQLASGVFVLPPDASAVHLSTKRLRIYEDLMKSASAGKTVFSPGELREIAKRFIGFPASLVNAFEIELGLLVQVSGKRQSKTDPCMRALVLRPYVGDDGQVVVPKLCHEHLSVKVTEPTAASTFAPPAVVRSKQELEAELILTEEEITSKRGERDRALAQWTRHGDELNERVRQLAEQLQAANQELAAHLATSDGTNDLTAELTQLGTRAEELRGLIATYDRTLALLLRR